MDLNTVCNSLVRAEEAYKKALNSAGRPISLHYAKPLVLGRDLKRQLKQTMCEDRPLSELDILCIKVQFDAILLMQEVSMGEFVFGGVHNGFKKLVY